MIKNKLIIRLKYLSAPFLALLLLLLVLPLLLLVTGLILIFDRHGPVFFRQERLGRAGRVFRMWKFRTMSVPRSDTITAPEVIPGDLVGKNADDPRITCIGIFLRRSSLDELPQLLNVLCGDMCLIGPRPLPLSEAAGLDPGILERRHRMKPGITGLWQVSGRSQIQTWDKRLELDLQYVEDWSMSMDLRIALKTIPAVLSCRGAW